MQNVLLSITAAPVWSMLHLHSMSVVHINKSALLNNLSVLRQVAPQSKIASVIKSNAYGHGLELVVPILGNYSDWFAVNTIEELQSIRNANTSIPVLVMGLGGHDLTNASLLQELEPFCVVVSSLDDLKKIQNIYKKIRYHVKIDTGLSRLGFQPSTFLSHKIEFLQDTGFEGVMTHFANVEDVSEQSYAKKQLKIFVEIQHKLQTPDIEKKILFHTAASAASMLIKEAQLDMIRPGISLYGFWPSAQTRLSWLSRNDTLPDLQPVLSWKARITHINQISAGKSVGYGCTKRVEKDTNIAVIPVGYYEGYDRRLSNQSYVLIKGQRAPLIGRVSMNMIIVDISLINGIKTMDEAILIGTAINEKTGQTESIHVDQLAEWSGSINYEVVTRILPSIPRIVV